MLLLAALALLLNFLGSVRRHAPPRDRFDFSAALCLTAAAAPAARPVLAAPAAQLPEQPPEPAADGAASCCPLCCGGDVALAATIFPPPVRAASAARCVVSRAGLAARPAAWSPQHPRAPPDRC
ncbi:MAG TPA: DUF2946 family protein [Rhodocyclaceae bacterium]|nr:DUF2946 family protein [Rhodocyclaceae bacterium]